jgi:hypothetical protein
LYKTHYLIIDKRKLVTTVPNFAGGGLPRADQGDRDFYCCSMMTLFVPWRKGTDIKGDLDSWDDVFMATKFGPKAKKMMQNLNLRYECNHERDDYYNQSKSGPVPMFSRFDRVPPADADQEETLDHYGNEEEIARPDIAEKGHSHLTMLDHMKEAAGIMKKCSWTRPFTFLSFNATKYIPSKRLSGSQWKARIAAEREQLLKLKFKNAPDDGVKKPRKKMADSVTGVKLVDSFHFTKYYKAKKKSSQKIIDKTASDFSLNEEQSRAFRLVANHATDPDPEQLKMYLGGIGGTGKSQVIRALSSFFTARGEAHRFIILAPTGTAAALLNGSTYHSVLGIVDSDSGERSEGTGIRKVRERLKGVEYIFIDEVSMVSCRNMYQISARLAKALNEPAEPFGGMNMIFAGDFAQLPPVGG